MNSKLLLKLLLAAVLLGGGACKKSKTDGTDETQNEPTELISQSPGVTFKNPLIDASRADPFVAQKDGNYYFMYTRGNNLGLRKTSKMSELSQATEKVIWTPPSGTGYSSNLWAPELHYISGKWYIYFAANDGGGDSHRMYVLENANQDPTVGTWALKGKISDTSDQWAIDGSILSYNGTNYFIWSGWDSPATRYKQYIYIAPMTNPWTISGERIMISAPTNNWEKYEPSGSQGLGVNEGPIMLQRDLNSPLFLIYSASRYGSDNYCLAQIQLKNGGNPINPADWINKKQVFVTSNENNVYGPGHNGFFNSSLTKADGTTVKEHWFIYHARSVANTSNGTRTPRMQKLSWNSDGSPNFGVPIASGIDLAAPINENAQ
ncbi:MAG: glycosyl hydrolase family 43 [Pedobacter sp.]|nr:MAG: glycosyl hydrolase family 43 [Pedobacter sp.]